MYCSIKNSGLPHSEISGSTLTYSSPKHIGVSPVLLQLLVPRHSPCALVHLTKLYYSHRDVMLVSRLFDYRLLLFSFQGAYLKDERTSIKTRRTSSSDLKESYSLKTEQTTVRSFTIKDCASVACTMLTHSASYP